MSRQFVVDASVAIGWVHPAQKGELSEKSLVEIEEGATLIAPSLWPLEVSNALLVLERRGKLQRSEREEALARISKLPISLDHDGSLHAFDILSRLATENILSVYDAAYLELAQRLNLPLACKDGPLRSAAEKVGIAIWAP